MMDDGEENPDFLSKQLITYIGNKRALLPFIGKGLERVKTRLGKSRLRCFDVFSGSGVVTRFLKQHSQELYANDLEAYSRVINRCYLTNREEFKKGEFDQVFQEITRRLEDEPLRGGLIAELYAPQDDQRIGKGERAFYTPRNARYIDTARALIGQVDEGFRDYLLAPLLSEASIHANTSGVFKGFYKNPETGVGQFGGHNRDAQKRIMGNIELPYPLFSNFSCPCTVLQGDANQVQVPELDLAYLDPPYNQHPYGSNYFMLNTILNYQRPSSISAVSGIPTDWNRSRYNKKAEAYAALADLVEGLKAKFLLLSFNSDGFIAQEEMVELLSAHGRVETLETRYNTFRGSRNLAGRAIHVKEYLYLLEKR